MAEYYEVYTLDDLFLRAQTLSTTPGFNGWTIADTSSGGTPTYAITAAGGLVLTLAATSEVENVCAYFNDILVFDIDGIHHCDIWADVAGVDAATSLAFGLASARNDTLDTVANAAWFRMEGGTSTTNVVVETDDGTNNNDDKATGKTLAATLKKFRIDFSKGKSDVRFFIDDSRVADSVTFDMSNYSGGLQPYVQVQKTAATDAASIQIRRFRVGYSMTLA